MKNELRLPADYAVMTEDEMTYTEGGSAAFDTFKVAATVVGSVVLGASYIWGISAARNWLSNKSNRKGNVLTVLGRAMDDIGRGHDQEPLQLPARWCFHRHGAGSGSHQPDPRSALRSRDSASTCSP